MNTNDLLKKGIVIGVLFLFFGAGVFPAAIGSYTTNTTRLSLMDTIQVDNEGDGDYETIQEAVNNANEGDLIEVYSGTYEENVVINTQVTLQGIDEELGSGGESGKPVVDGGSSGNVIDVQADGVIITGLVIQNSGKDGNINSGVYCRYYSTVELADCVLQENLNGLLFRDESDGHSIHDNRFLNNAKNSVWLKGSADSVIDNNVVKFSGESGIHLWEVSGAEVTNNVVTDASINGLYLEEAMGCTVEGNSFFNSTKGARLEASDDNLFTVNTFQGNSEHGVYIWDGSSENLFYLNNFLENDVHAYDPFSYLNNEWNAVYPTGGNYWDDYEGVDEDPVDGIGDSPYDVPAQSIDYYPQMYMEDPNPPVVTIVTPDPGYLYISGNLIMPVLVTTIVIRAINVTVDAIDIISGIERVEFYLDGVLKANDTTEPYNWLWSQWTLRKRHNLTVVAYDNAGNTNSTTDIVWKFL